ncbi:hypothetical protein K2X30_05250 [bacterium]|nr:hypothetical protein [bacterium]
MKRIKKSVVGVGIGLCLSGMFPSQASANSFSGDISPPFDLESAETLPANVRNPRIRTIFSWVDSEFTKTGQPQLLGARLTQKVKWTDVINAQPAGLARAQMQGILQDAGISESGSPGNTIGTVQSYSETNVFAMAMGVSDRLSVAVAVPVVNLDVSVDTGFQRSVEGQTFVNRAAAANPLRGQEAAAKLNNAINEKATSNGYEPIRSTRVQSIGDIRLLGKYNLQRDESRATTAALIFALPTGVAPNPNKALDLPTGSGQVAVGAQILHDYFFNPRVKWNMFGGYNFYIPKSMEKRIPLAPGDAITPDKEKVMREAEHQMALGTSLKYTVPTLGVTVGAGYVYQYQNQVDYSGGSQFDPVRYRWLSDLVPEQELHSALATIGFSSVDWYRGGRFFYPFQANLAYNHQLSGKNVTQGDIFSAELVLFF